MAKPAITVDFKGVEAAIQKAKTTRDELIRQFDGETEKATLRIANEAAKEAPRRDGHLKNSIAASPRRKAVMVWEVGSDREYAARQEYEHASKRGFFRKALFNERNKFREALRNVIAKVGGKA